MRVPVLRMVLGLGAFLSFLLVVHNYALNLAPFAYELMDVNAIRPDPGFPFTYSYPFDASEPDGPYVSRSRTRVFENETITAGPAAIPSVARAVGHGNWTHLPGRILFSASDNTDPRTNGRSYTVRYPLLYTHAIGRSAVLAFAACIAGLWWAGRRRGSGAPVARAPEARPGRWQLPAATALFLTGLYFCTGTLTPYANTTIPHVARASGYLYNPDHVHFHALFDFVDGKDRRTWDNAIMLRRVLYNVLAYPFMKAAGWEVGGTLASLVFNVAGFVVFVRAVRRRVGARGAAFAAWTLALYPGAAYWAGLPYVYALIVPGSLLLMLVLIAFAEDPGWRPVLLGSVALGVAYLGYDFFGLFLPASLLLLLWRRRWAAVPVSAALQLAFPLAWTLALRFVFHQNLANSNSNSFGAIVGAYAHLPVFARWRELASAAVDNGFDVFFGANFIFLPLLCLALAAVNAVTSRIRLHPAEAALLAAGLALYLFNNLAPDYDSAWQMRGSWIARLYQPVFPALLLFGARWYQHLPPLGRIARAGLAALWGIAALGNALVIFGPFLDNPLGISETAFYRFYDHANHANYESNLRLYGRRPLFFPRPPARPAPPPAAKAS